MGLLTRRHESQGEDDGVLAREGGSEEGGVVVGAFCHRDGGVGGEGCGGVFAGEDGDGEVLGAGEEVGEDLGADVAAGAYEGDVLEVVFGGGVGVSHC